MFVYHFKDPDCIIKSLTIMGLYLTIYTSKKSFYEFQSTFSRLNLKANINMTHPIHLFLHNDNDKSIIVGLNFHIHLKLRTLNPLQELKTLFHHLVTLQENPEQRKLDKVSFLSHTKKIPGRLFINEVIFDTMTSFCNKIELEELYKQYGAYCKIVTKELQSEHIGRYAIELIENLLAEEKVDVDQTQLEKYLQSFKELYKNFQDAQTNNNYYSYLLVKKCIFKIKSNPISLIAKLNNQTETNFINTIDIINYKINKNQAILTFMSAVCITIFLEFLISLQNEKHDRLLLNPLIEFSIAFIIPYLILGPIYDLLMTSLSSLQEQTTPEFDPHSQDLNKSEHFNDTNAAGNLRLNYN